MAQNEGFRPAGVLPGRVYVPQTRGPKKHPCPECFACQWCSDSRCEACRRCRACQAGAPGPSQATNR